MLGNSLEILEERPNSMHAVQTSWRIPLQLQDVKMAACRLRYDVLALLSLIVRQYCPALLGSNIVQKYLFILTENDASLFETINLLGCTCKTLSELQKLSVIT